MESSVIFRKKYFIEGFKVSIIMMLFTGSGSSFWDLGRIQSTLHIDSFYRRLFTIYYVFCACVYVEHTPHSVGKFCYSQILVGCVSVRYVFMVRLCA